jgi:preprotein translocase subunit SecD
MKTSPQIALLLVFALTLLCFLIDLPKVPLKFSFKNIDINTNVGGYTINLFGGKFIRDLEVKQGLDIRGGVRVLLNADMSKTPSSERGSILESSKAVVERRINLFGISESTVTTSVLKDGFRIVAEIPGITDPQKAVADLSKIAYLEFRQLKEGITQPNLLSDFESTDLSGQDLKRSVVDFDPNSRKPVISLEFTESGAKKFESLTEKNINKPLAIFLDNDILSSPTVREKITGGKAVISGDFTVNEINSIVKLLNAGSLPVPLSVMSFENILPSIGLVSVQKSTIAGAIGLLIVMLFMATIYGRLGVLANIALVVYGIVTLAVYKLVPIVLTLPGIAGFILSIGMAVDSNILIFERIKEEVRMGKPLKIALESGFGRAWDSIRDANLCTLITCFILFNPFGWSFLHTSGPIRGFALTLFLGIVVSLFTGIVVSRNLIRVFYRVSK